MTGRQAVLQEVHSKSLVCERGERALCPCCGRKITAGKARGLGERPQVIPHVGTNRVEFSPGAKDEPRIGRRCYVYVRRASRKCTLFAPARVA
jgi:hypothetical protein